MKYIIVLALMLAGCGNVPNDPSHTYELVKICAAKNHYIFKRNDDTYWLRFGVVEKNPYQFPVSSKEICS